MCTESLIGILLGIPLSPYIPPYRIDTFETLIIITTFLLKNSCLISDITIMINDEQFIEAVIVGTNALMRHNYPPTVRNLMSLFTSVAYRKMGKNDWKAHNDSEFIQFLVYLAKWAPERKKIRLIIDNTKQKKIFNPDGAA